MLRDNKNYLQEISSSFRTNAALALLAFSLAACQSNFDPQHETLTWEPVSSPPGYTGQCYGYFIVEGLLDQQHSFSSIWCGPEEKHEASIRQLDWKPIPTPPNSDGPCYGYFETEGMLDQQYSFSGAWCENN